ncbi:MAG: hypothetical protein WC405_03825 [Syntrophales bacterium]
MLKMGHLVPATVIKALPDYSSYLMAIPGTEHMALLDRAHAGSHLRVGDNTIASVYSIDGGRINLSQKSSPFYRRLTEMLVSPLLMEDRVRVVHAAAVGGAGFAKVAVLGLNGRDPIVECLPYIKTEAVRQYTETTITIVRYSFDIEKYVANAFVPAPGDDIVEVIHFKKMDEIHVIVKPERLGLFVGKNGANVATVSKLTGERVYVRPAR